MFSKELFWKLSEEKAVGIGDADGLSGCLRRSVFDDHRVTVYVYGKAMDPMGRPWDERKWAYDFDGMILWKVAERAVPRHAFESVPIAIMELAVRSLLGERIPGFSVNAIEPDGKWEPVAADAMIAFISDAILPDIRREISALPLRHEPRARLVKVENGMAHFERYDRSPVSSSKTHRG